MIIGIGIVMEALVQLGELRHGYYVSYIVRTSRISLALDGIEGDAFFLFWWHLLWIVLMRASSGP